MSAKYPSGTWNFKNVAEDWCGILRYRVWWKTWCHGSPLHVLLQRVFEYLETRQMLWWELCYFCRWSQSICLNTHLDKPMRHFYQSKVKPEGLFFNVMLILNHITEFQETKAGGVLQLNATVAPSQSDICSIVFIMDTLFSHDRNSSALFARWLQITNFSKVNIQSSGFIPYSTCTEPRGSQPITPDDITHCDITQTDGQCEKLTLWIHCKKQNKKKNQNFSCNRAHSSRHFTGPAHLRSK